MPLSRHELPVAPRSAVDGRGMTAAAGPAAAGTGGGGPARTLVVAHRGHRRRTRRAGATAPYTTIGAAVAAAKPGDTVLVCPGTYPEDVWVGKSISLVGTSRPSMPPGSSTGS